MDVNSRHFYTVFLNENFHPLDYSYGYIQYFVVLHFLYILKVDAHNIHYCTSFSLLNYGQKLLLCGNLHVATPYMWLFSNTKINQKQINSDKNVKHCLESTCTLQTKMDIQENKNFRFH